METATDRWLTAYFLAVIRHRWLVLGVVLAVTLGLGAAATRLHIEVDPDRLLPQDHPFIQTLNEVHALFGDKNLIVIGLFPHDGKVFTPTFLAKVAEVTARIKKVPGVNRALIQSLAAPQAKDVRGSGDVITVERVMATPPTDQAGADEVRRRAFANEMMVGTLVAADGSAALVQASFELTPEIPGYRNLHHAVLTAVAETADGTFDYRLAGPTIYLSQLSAYAGRMAIFFPLALVVIGLVHYHAFRTWQALFLPLATALLSVVWAVGLMGLLGVALDPFNTTTPILILAVAAGHAVQVLKRFYEEFERLGDVHEAVVASLVRVAPVMLAAGIVAALSFCSLVTFQTATIRTFGLFTGFGIVSALIIEMTVIPAVRAALPAPRGREVEREAEAHPILDGFLHWSARRANAGGGAVFMAIVVLLAACAFFASRLTVDMSMKREFSRTDTVRVDDAAINERFAGTNTLVLLVEAPSEGGLEEPVVLRAIYDLERRLEKEPGVGSAISFVDYVKRVHGAMTSDDPNAGVVPAKRDLATQELFLYSLSGGDNDLDTMIDPTHTRAKIRLLVHEDSTRYGLALLAKAQSIVAETFPHQYRVRYTGTLASTAAATEVMVHGKIRNIAQIAIITVVISAILLRSLVGGLLVAVPLALAVAVNFGVMGLLGIPLDTMTSAISAMAVGIGADYAMYFLFRTREELVTEADLQTALERSLATSGKAVLFVSSAVAFGYATLCLSGFAVHVQLGALVALAMLVSSGSALVVLPAIVARFRPAFLWMDAPPATRPVAPRRPAAAA
ncbi:MAG: MMPL family transporter [Candidatus Binatia bacterium]